jgi:hypothetical protein
VLEWYLETDRDPLVILTQDLMCLQWSLLKVCRQQRNMSFLSSGRNNKLAWSLLPGSWWFLAHLVTLKYSFQLSFIWFCGLLQFRNNSETLHPLHTSVRGDLLVNVKQGVLLNLTVGGPLACSECPPQGGVDTRILVWWHCLSQRALCQCTVNSE